MKLIICNICGHTTKNIERMSDHFDEAHWQPFIDNLDTQRLWETYIDNHIGITEEEADESD